MFSVTPVATSAAAGSANVRAAGSAQAQILMIIVMIAILYFMIFRPQKKREKENEKLRSNIEIGDEIITIGGVIGTVVSVKDDFLVLETSGDRNKIRITRWAIQTNNTALERDAKQKDIKQVNSQKNK